MDVSDRTLASLGFDDVLQALQKRCRTDVGRERAKNRRFLDTKELVLRSFELIEEARQLRAEPLTLPISPVTDIRASIDRAEKGGMLEPRELISICHALFAFERSHDMLQERRERYPALANIGSRLPTLDRLATKLDRSFDSSGEISDNASPSLAEARDRARALHRKIRQRLDDLLRDGKFGVNLQENYYSVRHDRYVVPVKSSHQRDIEGIVHNASQSGQTLFVEPTELIGIGNELAIAQSVVLEEERKVLIELSGLVGRERARIEDGVYATAELDELDACGILANDLHASVPLLEAADGAMQLRGLRHPRLILKEVPVVPNDVEVLGTARVLVISGPNAGGKTVTLTGAGLCALMTRAGLLIPADAGSKVPLFNQVHAAIGDQQDIHQGLSTFSAHVTMLREIVSTARGGALVMIDEIAADTDPREGAAIATAVLEELLKRGSLVLVTTHLEELKALAHLDTRFINARVGFDSSKMAPTYRLQMGFAGASSAIDIARRVGLPEDICKRASALATNAGGALSKAISAAEEERRKLYEERDAIQKDVAEAARLKAELEVQLADASSKRKAEELKFREALRAELEFARKHLRTLVDTIKAEKADAALKAAEQSVAELTARVNEQTVAERTLRDELKAPTEQPTVPLEIKVGAKARHKNFDTDVEIVELHGDQVTVVMGALRMRIPASDLSAPRKAAGPSRFPAPRTAERMANAEAARPQALTLAAPSLDVRGHRAEDATREVERFLDRLSRSGEQTGLVIHGHGTGALKTLIRGYLHDSPYAKSFRPGDGTEGGDGVTVVELA